MGLLDSTGWNKLQLIINRLFLPFIFGGYDDYLFVGITSYDLSLGGKETFVLLQLIKLKAQQLVESGVLESIPELDRLSNTEYIPKIIRNALKGAKNNTGIFRWNPTRKVYQAKEKLEQLLSEYLNDENKFLELVYAFDNYYREVFSSTKK